METTSLETHKNEKKNVLVFLYAMLDQFLIWLSKIIFYI